MFTETKYEEMVESIFQRFPSVQNTTFGEAYKPGLQHIENFCTRLGNPERAYRTIHVAGTNGKGSVANMLASVLAGAGLKVGLYTSPHILDFRERMRVVDGRPAAAAELVSKEYVYDFLSEYSSTFDELDLSFFEITTGLAFKWFAEQKVDVAVIEVGLGGRLDSTNVIVPDLSIVTSIGLDHCDLLGDTLEKIAFEKAGIFKRGVSAVIGETRPETAPVFKKYFAEVNQDAASASLVFAEDCEPSKWYLSPDILKNMDLRGTYQKKNLRTVLAALDVLQTLWKRESSDNNGAKTSAGACAVKSAGANDLAGEGAVKSASANALAGEGAVVPGNTNALAGERAVKSASANDLAGEGAVEPGNTNALFSENSANPVNGEIKSDGTSESKIEDISTTKVGSATMLKVSDISRFENAADSLLDNDILTESLIHTACRMDFHGRWERLSTNPEVLCDIGHNAPALAYNFAQLEGDIDSDEFTSLIIVYGVMADKNFDAIMPLFPENATWIFTTPQTRRAEPASRILERYSAYCKETGRSVSRLYVQDSVRDAVALALKTASSYGGRPLVYIGGSTFVVSEATKCF